MKLPVFLTKEHLKNCRQYMVVITTACYFYSGSWLVVEVLSHFWCAFEEWSRGNFGLLIGFFLFGLLLVGVGRFLWKCRAMLSVSHRLDETDISIEVRVDDIFSLTGAFIISTNTTFDTDMSEELISEESLQGQFTKKYYDKEEHLDQELVEVLKEEEFILDENKPKKKERYEIGTVAKVSPRDQLAYFVAIADLNQHGVAYSSLDNVREGLKKVWSYIANQGGFDRLIIPVLGTGRARIQVPREVMVREIIRSFINARYSENKFCEKLTIVIFEKDYCEHNIDLQELEDYIRLYAKQEHWQRHGGKAPIGKSV